MEPLLSLTLLDPRQTFQPGELLIGEYQIDSISPEEITSVELSVLWYTEGKGDEDMAVHYFQRRVPADAENHDLRCLHRFQTQLPNSPLSYSGVNLKIRWCIRLRLFLLRGREVSTQVSFQLGAARQAEVITDPRSHSVNYSTANRNAAPPQGQQVRSSESL